MMPKSLRWRLPLSYAAIALIATIVLGAILLTLLQRYYRQQERDYLAGNAQAIGERIVPLVQEMDVGQLQATVKGVAFLSQTRVQIVSPDGDLLLADSGDPRLADANTEIAFSVEVDGIEQVFNQTFPDDSLDEPSETTIVVEPGFLGSNVDQTVSTEVVVTRVVDLGEGDQITMEQEVLGEAGTITRTTIVTREIVGGVLPVIGTQFGFGFANEAPRSTAVSDLVVRQAVEAEDGRLLGYVELSQGPAYGRDILQSVFWGWLVASLVAVFLAGVAGWLMSRRLVRPLLTLTAVTTRMAAGDLTARTDVQRRDELGALGRAFNQMAGQVEEKIVALRQFVADAAHELHTPLTALQTDLELLADASPAPENDAKIQRAREQAARLQALADSLLDLSRIEASTDQPMEEISLNRLAQEAAELYASQAEQAGLDFSFFPAGEPLWVQGHPMQLRRALHNLLDNAVKFTPAPGVVTLSLARAGDRAQIDVTDTGIGIPEEDRPHLFGRFHRGRNTADYAGSGLGLTIVKAIVDGHAGRIAVSSDAGGTRIQLSFPLIQR